MNTIIPENKNIEIEGYLKFFGEAVDQGKIDIEEIGNALIALKKMFNVYQEDLLSKEVETYYKGTEKKKKNIPLKKQEDKKLTIKLGGIKKNCTEVNIFFESIAPVAQTATNYAGAVAILNATGVTAFCKQFMKNLADQTTLKLFKKGKKTKTKREFVANEKIYVEISDEEGNTEIFEKEVLEQEKKYSPYMKDFVRVGKGINKMETGYKEKDEIKKLTEVTEEDRDFFEYKEEKKDIDTRLEEDFNEDEAISNEKIIGQFVDFYGMAHKYHFAFQSRCDQERTGKKKILCIVNEKDIDPVFDLLKKSYKNKKFKVCIGGSVVKDNEGKIDKIKIEWISEDENFDPKQDKIKI